VDCLSFKNYRDCGHFDPLCVFSLIDFSIQNWYYISLFVWSDIDWQWRWKCEEEEGAREFTVRKKKLCVCVLCFSTFCKTFNLNPWFYYGHMSYIYKVKRDKSSLSKWSEDSLMIVVSFFSCLFSFPSSSSSVFGHLEVVAEPEVLDCGGNIHIP